MTRLGLTMLLVVGLLAGGFAVSSVIATSEDERIEATVTSVWDGDSIRVQVEGEDEEWRIRYLGIDAPERPHRGKEGEPYWKEAREANKDLVSGRMVYLEKDEYETDYEGGRYYRYIYRGCPKTRILVARGNLKVEQL